MTTEQDPHGLDPHTDGAKCDAGKVDMDLVMRGFARALVEVGKVGTCGAAKYTRDGWKTVPNGIKRYESAEQRHYFKEEIEGEIDPDFGLLHKAHKAWNALAALELRLIEIENEKQAVEETKFDIGAIEDEKAWAEQVQLKHEGFQIFSKPENRDDSVDGSQIVSPNIASYAQATQNKNEE